MTVPQSRVGTASFRKLQFAARMPSVQLRSEQSTSARRDPTRRKSPCGVQSFQRVTSFSSVRGAGMGRRGFSRIVTSSIGAALLATGVLAGTSSSGAATHPRTSTTLNVGFELDNRPTSVFPFYTSAQCTAVNIEYWHLMYRPGYWFGLGSSVAEQPKLSSFNPPTITTSDGKTTASFTIKPWAWSDANGPGASKETLDAQTVAFWLNMDKAEATNSNGEDDACAYTPGVGLPDQVSGVTYSGSATPGTGDQVSITFNTTLNARFLLYNQLSQIQPMPVAWDATSSGGAPGSGGCSSETYRAVKNDGSDACTSVFKYLNGLSPAAALWHWSDGPYRQQTFGYPMGSPDQGNDVQVTNTNYSGSPKPSGALTIDYIPYADGSTQEVHALRSGALDLGYLNTNDLSKSPGSGKAGHILLRGLTKYKAVGSALWGVFYWSINFGTKYSTSPQTEANPPVWVDELNQTYIRGALQQSIDQAGVIASADNGYATPTISAIPMYPSNPYSAGVKNPYPFSVSNAKATLTVHHWKIIHGVQTCQVTNCGTLQYPIAMGSTLRFTLIGPSGEPSFSRQVTEELATIKQAGIAITLEYPGPVVVEQCSANQLWELCGYGGWMYAPDYYPDGSQLFLTDAASNVGGYSDPIMDGLIRATDFSGLQLNQVDPTYHTSYAQYSATSVPVLWQPTSTSYQVVARSVKGFQSPNPLGDFNPEFITAL
jgi:peptide/nickel transport system substrate-binding protein